MQSSLLSSAILATDVIT